GDGVADLRRRVALLRILEADLARGVLERLDDEKMPREMQLARLRVDVGMQVRFRAVAGARGLRDRFLHRAEHDSLVDGFFAGDRFGDLQKLEAVCTDGHCFSPKIKLGVFRFARGSLPRLVRVVSRASSSS